MTQAHPRPALPHCRRLLSLAGVLAIAAGLCACASKPGPWPARALPPSAAVTVDATQFLSRKQLLDWQVDLDERRLRATGSPRHEAYIDALRERLARAGVKQLGFEPVSFRQWSVQPEDWGLEVVSGDRPGVLPSAGYIPYSGMTPPSGMTGRLAYLAPGIRPNASLAGKLVLVELPTVAWTGQAFRQSAAHVHDPQNAMGPDTPYARPFQRLEPFIALLDGLQAAGAAGVIVILDTPSRTADGLYAPHDGVARQLPGVFIDRAQGQRLREGVLAGTAPILRLTMAATVRQAQTRNLIGIIPGKSEELMVLASHTDGPNGLDDNGPNAIVDMAQYLARLPQGSLPRSVMLLLTSGHFAGGVGIEQFFKRHQDDGLTQRMAAMLAIEHLGALEVLPDSDGYLHPTGRVEPAALFSPRTPALLEASYAMLKQVNAAPAFVLPSSKPGQEHAAWFGEDPYFQSAQPVPTLHYMAQPYYLLDHGIDTTTQLDYRLMQRQILALTQMLLDLSRVPPADLRKETAP
ncbi:M28 family peptidase [Janthinobacterium rivuli]|uniref:M28 family metallopeptidase n=1 Tax=Janthinobacterium sp. FT68W TaxID=2654255 RepID=UPI001264D67D|nr:M28 family metallopeptidase [Janthinobacterium sp. FT68W]KAB8052536.1 M28 family peptidase [Janthinobacterium sp. FT68W]